MLKSFDANLIDSMVTDPPAGISFMGKEWDHHKGGRNEWIKWLSEVMAECFRVMKPGAHGLVWAIPRTSHWTSTALEDAGFEIRDVVTHLFGSGFPKSLDVSKAIDKMHGAEREVVGTYQSPENTSGQSDGSGSNFGIGGLNSITAPSTNDAKQWQGWGTALKPAAEFWILARKPLSEKTVAKNVLKWGCGALNIDGSRIDGRPRDPGYVSQPEERANTGNGKTHGLMKPIFPNQPTGRFPANLVFSCSTYCTDDQHDIECAIKMLDEQSGKLKSGGTNRKNKGKQSSVYGKRNAYQSNFKDDSILNGGASRFFYCAKVSSSERGEDNKHPTVKSIKLMSYLIKLVTPPNGTVLDPFMGSGSTGIAAKKLGFKFIGIEKEKDYFEIAEKRIEAAL